MALLGASITATVQDETTGFLDTGPAPAPTVDIGGAAVTREQLEKTIKYLAGSKGSQVKIPLVQAGSPVAAVDYLAIVAGETALDPALRKGKAKTKKALLRHLYRKLADFDDASAASGPAKDGPPAEPKPPADPALFQSYLANGTGLMFWSIEARRAFCEHYQLDTTDTCSGCVSFTCWHTFLYERMLAKLTALKNEAAKAAVAAALVPVYTPASPQPKLSGWHSKTVLVDQHGDRWLFKPAPGGRAFRSEVEHGAHRLARAWGFPTAESHLIVHDGEYGQLQRMFVETGNFVGITGEAFATLSVRQLIAVACEHILDWALDNDDTKGDNLIITEHGQVVGVDKARAWLYYGGWDGLSSHDSANSNAPLVYTELYRAIKAHSLAKETVDIIYRAVRAKAHRMSALPDSTLATIIRDAVRSRPHFQPPPYRAAIPSAPADADELVAAATARKSRLAEDMQALWARVYADAGWELPELAEPELGYNAQGHPMYAGLHSPGLHESVTWTKSYGTAAFVAGTDIEDGHILLWRERVKATGVYRIRGQLKVRSDTAAYTSMTGWCKTHAVAKQGQPEDTWALPHHDWYWAVVKANRDCGESWNYHYLSRALAKIEAQRAETNSEIAAHGHSPYGKCAAILAMCSHYENAIKDIIERRKSLAPHQPILGADYTKFDWAPALSEKAELPESLTVELVHASRAAASRTTAVMLGDDGELDLDGSVLFNLGTSDKDYGQYGGMYLITLPTGEEIEFRDKEVSSLTMAGTVQFTIPDQSTMAESLHRIEAQLAVLGLTITPADRTDLELFYWRHLHGVLAERNDSKPAAHKSPYQKFWKLAPHAEQATDRDTELGCWRAAFATLPGGERIPGFVEAGGHLPRFLHLDLRQPEQPCGKPHWLRFDVSQDEINAKPCLGTAFGHGPHYVMATGAAMSTEARMRTFAMFKPGASARTDFQRGSGDYTFSRQNYSPEQADTLNVLYRPDVLARTHTYTFNMDRYGCVASRKSLSHFRWDEHTGCTNDSNETMVKYAMSLLDDVEILFFDSEWSRQEAINKLAGHGITEIRGMPVGQRLITGGKIGRRIALERARKARSQ